MSQLLLFITFLISSIQMIPNGHGSTEPCVTFTRTESAKFNAEEFLLDASFGGKKRDIIDQDLDRWIIQHAGYALVDNIKLTDLVYGSSGWHTLQPFETSALQAENLNDPFWFQDRELFGRLPKSVITHWKQISEQARQSLPNLLPSASALLPTDTIQEVTPLLKSTIQITARGAKDLKSYEALIQKNYQTWVNLMEEQGVQEVKKIRGYHIEKLASFKNTYSARLSQDIRIIFCFNQDVISVIAITRHRYETLFKNLGPNVCD